MTSCGETSERLAATLHGTVSLLYAMMLLWHATSALKHWVRSESDT